MDLNVDARTEALRNSRWRQAWLTPVVVGPVWWTAWSGVEYEPWRGIGTLAGAVLLSLCIVSTWTDFRTFRIPNWSTYPAIAWSFLVHGGVSIALRLYDADVVAGFAAQWLSPLSGLGEALLGMLVGGAPLGLHYRLTGRGAGDVKLAAAVGSWIGAAPTATALVAAYCLAGVYAFGRACILLGPWAVLHQLLIAVGSFLAPRWIAPARGGAVAVLDESVPMAGFLTVGVLIALIGAPK